MGHRSANMASGSKGWSSSASCTGLWAGMHFCSTNMLGPWLKSSSYPGENASLKWQKYKRISPIRQAYLKSLLSLHLPTSHWSKQIPWLSLKSNGGKEHCLLWKDLQSCSGIRYGYREGRRIWASNLSHPPWLYVEYWLPGCCCSPASKSTQLNIKLQCQVVVSCGFLKLPSEGVGLTKDHQHSSYFQAMNLSLIVIPSTFIFYPPPKEYRLSNASTSWPRVQVAHGSSSHFFHHIFFLFLAHKNVHLTEQSCVFYLSCVFFFFPILCITAMDLE